MIRRLYEDQTWPFQLARYVSIGSFCAAVDLGSFTLLLRAGWPLLAVITVSYALGVVAHFSLNKYVNFRAHDRPVRLQAANYAVVTLVLWLTTTAIVKGAVALGITPIVGKIAAIAFNVPLAFFGHRQFTFGRGLMASLRELSGPKT